MDPIEKTSVIGTRVPKPDAKEKVIGRTQYINDMVLPQMLYGKILHADRPHACIVSVDASAAKALLGVHVVLTGKEMPKLLFGVNRDNRPLKGEKVRCIRDEIAAVAAESEEICDAALGSVEIQDSLMS